MLNKSEVGVLGVFTVPLIDEPGDLYVIFYRCCLANMGAMKI